MRGDGGSHPDSTRIIGRCVMQLAMIHRPEIGMGLLTATEAAGLKDRIDAVRNG